MGKDELEPYQAKLKIVEAERDKALADTKILATALHENSMNQKQEIANSPSSIPPNSTKPISNKPKETRPSYLA
ncbi:MAG: hypothetical protein JRN20_13590 [Nitrososphaerota archaeon]|nr:hypothetical protein [Nitrososphaerota archaeon]MDG6923378.1 hypothetical protein [Nitrososphaerota archaeon]